MNVVIFYDLKRLEEIGVSEQYILNFRDDVNYNFIANPCCRLPTYVFNLEELQKSKNSLSETLFIAFKFEIHFGENNHILPEFNFDYEILTFKGTYWPIFQNFSKFINTLKNNFIFD